jgi:hypothetical protein|tara:strand:+ start:104610 stop:105122 length:513 start_codon:yes stop_codon:yes gene_type:complete
MYYPFEKTNYYLSDKLITKKASMEYLVVYLSSSFRFILGPSLGIGLNMGVLLTTLLTAAGMMSTVLIITYFSEQIKQLTRYLFKTKKKKVFTTKKRKFIKIWNAYGIKGVAFFTPIILSPVVGAILINAFSSRKIDIIKWMSLSAFFWALVESTLFFYAENTITRLLDGF